MTDSGPERYLPLALGTLAGCVVGVLLLLLGPFGDRDEEPAEIAREKAVQPVRGSTHYKTLSPIVTADRKVDLSPLRGPSDVDVARRDPEPRSIERGRTQLVAFASAPFPYEGTVPRTREPFLNFEEGGRRAHRTASGRVYWADQTYSDRRVLLHIPKGFDPKRPAVMVLFFHGHKATLERDVAVRQRLPAQISGSGANAVLVAPQFAVNARDSSSGNFWTPGGTRLFLSEVAEKLATMHGAADSVRAFAKMPVVMVGYSGGYAPAASTLLNGNIGKRLKGVVLLDALYSHVETFAKWIARNRSAFFLSAYTRSTRRGNNSLKQALSRRQIPYRNDLGARLQPGSVTFIAADEPHRDYVTRAWTDDPVGDLLARMNGISPRRRDEQSASLLPSHTR